MKNLDKTIQPFVKYYNAKKYMLIKYPKYWPKKISQKGGTYPKKVKININNKMYKFVYENADNIHFYMLYDNKDNERCVMIIIDEPEKNTLIDNINGDYQYFRSSCSFLKKEQELRSTHRYNFFEKVTKCGPNGSKLLDATIKFLKEYKDDLKIKRIVLTDNSIKKCVAVEHFF